MNDTNKRLAALIKFHDGVTFEEAVAALRSIKHLLDVPDRIDWDGTQTTRRPTLCKEVVRKYNPDHGEPVFYIP